MATVGAAGTRRNEAGELHASGHEERSEGMRVYQARGGVAGTAQAAKAGSHPEDPPGLLLVPNPRRYMHQVEVLLSLWHPPFRFLLLIHCLRCPIRLMILHSRPV